MATDPSQVRKTDPAPFCPKGAEQIEKGPEDRPFLHLVFCSLSDWPTSWVRTLRRIDRVVNGILQEFPQAFGQRQ
jgi:hypothetical protein